MLLVAIPVLLESSNCVMFFCFITQKILSLIIMIFPPPTFHAHPYFAILISVFTVIISCDSFSFNRDFCISEFYYILRFIKFNIQLFNSFHEKILLVLLGFDFYSSKYVRIKTLWVHKSKFLDVIFTPLLF